MTDKWTRCKKCMQKVNNVDEEVHSCDVVSMQLVDQIKDLQQELATWKEMYEAVAGASYDYSVENKNLKAELAKHEWLPIETYIKNVRDERILLKYNDGKVIVGMWSNQGRVSMMDYHWHSDIDCYNWSNAPKPIKWKPINPPQTEKG